MTPILYAVWLLLTAGVTYMALTRYDFAVVWSLTAAIMWFVWAQSSWSIEVATGAAQPYMASYPTLAVFGYLAFLGMALSALVAGIGELADNARGTDSVAGYIDRRMGRV